MRKIIQVAVLQGRPDSDPRDFVYAVCEDGSLWCMEANVGKWERMAPIPQSEVPS